jgi:hypothetical protein
MEYPTTNEHFGKEAIDLITGFRGIVIGFVQYVTGCDQYLITPRCESDNKKPEPEWFDVNRIEFCSPVLVSVDTREHNGPDIAAPKI